MSTNVLQNDYPMSRSIVMLKWQSLYCPLLGPKNEHSSVYELKS